MSLSNAFVHPRFPKFFFVTYEILRSPLWFRVLYMWTIFGFTHLIIIEVRPAVDPPMIIFDAETARLSPWPRAIDKNPIMRINAPKQVNGVEWPGMWYFRILPVWSLCQKFRQSNKKRDSGIEKSSFLLSSMKLTVKWFMKLSACYSL